MRGIYGIRCLRNGRLYVGSSIHMRLRWNQHRGQLRHGKHSNRDLQADWTVFGEGAFQFEILERVPSANLDIREEYHIAANSVGIYNVGRSVTSRRVERGIDYETPRSRDERLDDSLFWTWAAAEIEAEWDAANKHVIYRRSDVDPGVMAKINAEWREAVAERAEALRRKSLTERGGTW